MSRAALDEVSCARHLAARRWPDGFVCPACGHDRGWGLKRRRASWECRGLREGDLGDRARHAPQPLAPEDLVHGRSHRDQPLEWYLRPATPGPARARPSCAVPWSIRIAACLRQKTRSRQDAHPRAAFVLRCRERVITDIAACPTTQIEPSMACAAPREFVFRWNRRRHTATAFDTPRHRHAPATRRLPRHRRTTRLIPAGRAPATARPPRLNRSRIPALQA